MFNNINYYFAHSLGLLKGLSSDVMALAVFFLAVLSYGLYRGKESLFSLLLSLYLAMTLYSSSTFLKSLLFFRQNNIQLFFSRLIVYFIIVIAINFLINRIIGVRFRMSKIRDWFEVVAMSVAVVASFIVIAFNILALSLAYTPSLLPVSLLSSGTALVWTFIGSFVIVFFAAR
ncbi:TPA: hypothetical protein DCQ44_02175 [Candidatus Taylorbacteria bacterium]|nr:hypothetical protein [Candidatus Taylorbacteria bacterium]